MSGADDDLEQLRAFLEGLPPQPRPPTLRQTVTALADTIRRLRERHWSYDAIASKLRERSIEVAPATLRTYVARPRKRGRRTANAPADTSVMSHPPQGDRAPDTAGTAMGKGFAAPEHSNGGEAPDADPDVATAEAWATPPRTEATSSASDCGKAKRAGDAPADTARGERPPVAPLLKDRTSEATKTSGGRFPKGMPLEDL